MTARHRRNRIAEQFIAHTRRMRESPAWHVLPDVGRRVLDRLELEHMHQGGQENGRLRCPYSDFEKAGIRRRSIAQGIRACIALGFVEKTEQGYRASNGFCKPSSYRLTYVFSANKHTGGLPTDEWARLTTIAAAKIALRDAIAKAAEDPDHNDSHPPETLEGWDVFDPCPGGTVAPPVPPHFEGRKRHQNREHQCPQEPRFRALGVEVQHSH